MGNPLYFTTPVKTRFNPQASICPVTMGNPTRMTRAAFKAACAEKTTTGPVSNQIWFRSHNLYAEHCKACGGRPPKELTFITKKELKEMGAST